MSDCDLELRLSLPNQSPSRAPPPPEKKRKTREEEPETLEENPEKITTIPVYEWGTNEQAKVKSKRELLHAGINKICGTVKCTACGKQFDLKFDLEKNYSEVVRFIIENRDFMHDRAPREWSHPTFPTCPKCGAEKACRPLISAKKEEINWLFLLLGQMLGCCSLDQLKYFCLHNNIHRTAAKDRLLYLIYIDLCQQLDSRVRF